MAQKKRESLSVTMDERLDTLIRQISTENVADFVEENDSEPDIMQRKESLPSIKEENVQSNEDNDSENEKEEEIEIIYAEPDREELNAKCMKLDTMNAQFTLQNEEKYNFEFDDGVD